MSYNYKTRPHALYMHKDGIKSRVTTLIHKQLTLPTFVSVRQHSGAVNVRHYVTAYYCKISNDQKQIRCEARGCIRTKVPMRLSSAGSFLYLPLNCTSSRQSLCSASINAIISTKKMICQVK